MNSLQSNHNSTSASPPLPPTYAELNSSVSSFFAELYGEMPKDFHIVFWRKSNRLAQYVPLQDLDSVISKYVEDSQIPDLYFGVGLHKQPPMNSGSSRGMAADVVAIPGLWFDMDCINGEHIQTMLPTAQEAMDFLENLPFGHPSIIVDSGGGFHVYWLFREPWLLEDQQEWESAAKLSLDFHYTVKELGRSHGWELDITADLSRVLRVPGSVNAKSKPCKNVKIIRHDSNLKYNQSDFEPYLVDSNIWIKQPKHVTPQVLWLQESMVSLTPIINGCSWLQHCQSDAKTLPEPEWFAMLTILAKGKGGTDLAHKFSKPYPTYTPQETERKLQHASTLRNVYSCRKISGLTSGKYCHHCYYRNAIQNPLEIGTQESMLEDLNQLKNLLSNSHGG